MIRLKSRYNIGQKNHVFENERVAKMWAQNAWADSPVQDDFDKVWNSFELISLWVVEETK